MSSVERRIFSVGGSPTTLSLWKSNTQVSPECYGGKVLRVFPFSIQLHILVGFRSLLALFSSFTMTQDTLSQLQIFSYFFIFPMVLLNYKDLCEKSNWMRTMKNRNPFTRGNKKLFDYFIVQRWVQLWVFDLHATLMCRLSIVGRNQFTCQQRVRVLNLTTSEFSPVESQAKEAWYGMMLLVNVEELQIFIIIFVSSPLFRSHFSSLLLPNRICFEVNFVSGYN